MCIIPCLVQQISGLEIDLKSIPTAVISVIALTFIQHNLSMIFTGGAGKNGSTVAVRVYCSIVNLLFFLFSSCFVAFLSFCLCTALNMHANYSLFTNTFLFGMQVKELTIFIKTLNE